MSTKKHTLRVYPSRKVKGQWGWTLTAPNGKKVATCGELYTSKAHAVKMARSMKTRFDAADLVVGAPKKAPAKFRAGVKVIIAAGEWGKVQGVILRRSTFKGDWICKVTEGQHKGATGSWSENKLKAVPEKAKRITKKITNPVK